MTPLAQSIWNPCGLTGEDGYDLVRDTEDRIVIFNKREVNLGRGWRLVPRSWDDAVKHFYRRIDSFSPC